MGNFSGTCCEEAQRSREGFPGQGCFLWRWENSPLGLEALGDSSQLAGLLVAASFGEVSTYQSSSTLSLALWFSARSVLLFLEKALLMWTGGNLCTGQRLC